MKSSKPLSIQTPFAMSARLPAATGASKSIHALQTCFFPLQLPPNVFATGTRLGHGGRLVRAGGPSRAACGLDRDRHTAHQAIWHRTRRSRAEGISETYPAPHNENPR